MDVPSHGEHKFTLLLGGLHIEMAYWSTIGRLTESGWTNIISEAGITTDGTSESLLASSHLMKTRNAHITTVLALKYLQKEAMTDDSVTEEKKATWITERTKDNPTFLFWEVVKNLETMILTLVRAQRGRNLCSVLGIYMLLLILTRQYKLQTMDAYSYKGFAKFTGQCQEII